MKAKNRADRIVRQGVFELVEAERDRQDAKWGEQNHVDDYWLGIAVEEVGEVAKAVIERDDDAVHEEIVQTIAVLFGWLEAIARRGSV
jgi:NTP pyrophosphatase (non-canonical NTP hydrolase)